jgi:acyl dehydratase
MPGRFFDEWQVGDRVAHAISRTITETDNILITTLTHNPQPLHIDAEAAKDSEFGQILVNSCLTFSLVVGVSVADTTLGTLVANLGFDEVRLPKPRCSSRARLLRCAKASRGRTPASSPGSIARPTSAARPSAR